MIDIQSSRDQRQIPLDQVGVRDLRYPIVVLDRAHKEQHTIANFEMSVNLPHQFKGTHMSRFIEVLNAHQGEVTMRTLPLILGELRSRLHAESAHVVLSFPYFVERTAPVSGARALMDYKCTFSGRIGEDGQDFSLSVKVPVTTLCPCSKAISDYGAHNQRGIVDMHVRMVNKQNGDTEFVWIEEIIDAAEKSGSAPVYALLKRVDERHVTMQAFDNPVFVEDIVRNVALILQADTRIASFTVEAENLESIHNHSAFARTSWVRASAPAASSRKLQLRSRSIKKAEATLVV